MRYHHNISEDLILDAARALLKFSRDHGHVPGAIAQLEACVSALQSGDFRGAFREFDRMSFGRMGSFDEWFPSVIHDHEDGPYVWTVYRALVERFVRLFRTAAGKAT